jgi:glycosyltransferase involved in cell wall biosynthesis
VTITISLILPVYNPSDGWAEHVIASMKQLIALYPSIVFDTMIVNDGSVSEAFANGQKKLHSQNIKLIEYIPNKGKGEALRTGVRASSGDFFIYTDIDFPYTIESVCRIIEALKDEKQNVVIGIKDQSYYDHVPAVRRFISRLFRFFVRLLLQIPTDDTQCGLKGFDQKGKAIFLSTTIDRYLFDLEFVFLASREKDIRIKTQEIKLRPDVQFRKMNFGIIQNEAWNFLKILMRS